MSLNRRNFLKYSLGLSSAGLMPGLWSSKAHAQNVLNTPPKMFLQLRLNGAWDTLMTTDAKDIQQLQKRGMDSRDFYNFDYRNPSRVHKNTYLGSVLNPLTPYLNDISIINGVLMLLDSNSHFSNRRYMTTGSSNDRVPFFSFQAGHAVAVETPTRLGYHTQFESPQATGKINPIPLSSLAIKETVTDPMYALLEDQVLNDMDIGVLGAAIRESYLQKDIYNRLFDVMPTVRERLGSETSESARLHSAIAGLESGYLQMAQIDLTLESSLDTHTDHRSQQNNVLGGAFSQIAKLIKYMKETVYKGAGADGKSTLFDLTTVLVTSEFSRTVWPESNDGTGHNQFSNSVITFGGGMKGGEVIGESQIYSRREAKSEFSRYQASPYDFETLKALSLEEIKTLDADRLGRVENNRVTLDYIYPETIWRTVAASMKIETPILGSGNVLKKLLKG